LKLNAAHACTLFAGDGRPRLSDTYLADDISSYESDSSMPGLKWVGDYDSDDSDSGNTMQVSRCFNMTYCSLFDCRDRRLRQLLPSLQHPFWYVAWLFLGSQLTSIKINGNFILVNGFHRMYQGL